MKIIFNIISVIMVSIVIFLGYLNMNTKLGFIVWKGINNSNFLVFHSHFFLVILIVFVCGIVVGTCWAATHYFPMQKRLKVYQRQLEKTSVKTTEESSKVAVLEAKIQTLEKALHNALNKE